MAQSFNHIEEHIDENMIKIEVNLDDISSEWLGFVMDKLFEQGANDVYYSSIHMKKNRPGILLQILCQVHRLDEMKNILFNETTTLGIRYYPLQVHRLGRRFISVSTKWGNITVKEGIFNGDVVQRSPEYEECRKIALQNQVPLKMVYHEIWKNY